MAKTKTMYMHTLDGKPALVVWYRRGPFITHATQWRPVQMERSLRNIRRSQEDCLKHATAIGDHEEFTVAARYGYVRVEVPSDA